MGTGYTRQSAADIITGANITAAPLNAEFNAIQSAFNSSTGHSHDGTSGEGPLIDLTSSITGLLPAANGGFAAIHKVDATTAPTANEDSGDGYGPGSFWVDVTNDIAYVCLDASPTAAVWQQVSFESTVAAIGDLTPTDGNIIVGDGSSWVAESGATARTSLGLAIGTNVQAWDTQLDDIAALAVTDGNIIVGNGTNWVAESGATARTSLGLAIGTDVQAFGAVLDDLNTLGAPATDGEFIVATGAGAFAYESGATARTSLGLGSLATLSSIASINIAASALVTEAEGLNSSDNDTSWPTTAAVKDYVDSAVSGVGFAMNDLSDVTITSIASGEIVKWNGSAFINNTLAEAGIVGAADFTADSEVLVGTGSGTYQAESGATLRTSLGLAIGTNVQAYDVDTLKADVADTLTAGFRDTMDDDGTKSSGTYTPTDSAGTWSKKIVNGGAFTLAPPSPANNEVIYGSILMINNASAGAVTVTGWTNTGGDTLDTTNTNKFIGNFVVFDVGGTEYSFLTWSALQ